MGRTSSAVKDRYNAKAYDEIKVRVSKGKKDIIQAHAEARGESVNGFINRAIDQTMAQEATGSPTAGSVLGVVSFSETGNTAPAAPESRAEGTADGD